MGGLREGWLLGPEQALIDQKVKLKMMHNVTIYIMNALLQSRRYCLRSTLKHSIRYCISDGMRHALSSLRPKLDEGHR